MSSDNHTQPDTRFKASLVRNGHVIEIKLDKPKILTFPAGHPFCTLKDDCMVEDKREDKKQGKEEGEGVPIRHFPELLRSLRDRKLPPDKGPYADNANTDVGKIAFEMQKVGKGNLEEEARWLIDVIYPRASINEDGPHVFPIDEERGYRELSFIMNPHPFAGRNQEATSAGRLLEQEKVEVEGSEYSPIIFTEEIPLVATAVMRARGMEAYLTLMDCQEFVDGKMVKQLIPGVAVFTDEGTLVSFSNSRTHFNITAMLVYSDMAAMATMMLRSAEVARRGEFLQTMGAMEHDLIDDEYVDKTIRLIKERGALAATMFAAHHELDVFLGKAELDRVSIKGELHKRKVTVPLDEIFTEVKKQGIAKMVEKKGLFGRSKGFEWSAGVLPDDIEALVRELIDVAADGYQKCGPNSEHIQLAHTALNDFIEDKLPKYGFPLDKMHGLYGYLEARLATANSKDVYDRLTKAGMAEWTELKGQAYEQEITNAVVALHEAIREKKTSPEDAVIEMKSLVVRVADGTHDLGSEDPHIRQANAVLGSFVAKMLPHMDFPEEAHAEVMKFVVEVLVPATQKKQDGK